MPFKNLQSGDRFQAKNMFGGTSKYEVISISNSRCKTLGEMHEENPNCVANVMNLELHQKTYLPYSWFEGHDIFEIEKYEDRKKGQ